MSQSSGSRRRSASRNGSRARKRRRRIIGWSITGGIALLLIGGVASVIWVGSRAFEARDELTAAFPMATTIKDQVLAQDTDAANASVKAMKKHVERAAELTSDPVWQLAEAVPGVGPNLTAVRQLTASARTVVVDGVQPVVSVASSLNPETFRPIEGHVDTAPIIAAAPTLTAASTALKGAQTDLAAVKTDGTFSQVSTAAVKLKDMLSDTVPTIDAVAHVMSLAPGVLGVEGERKYLIIFQNNAEARALGGIVGSSVLLSADNGAISLDKQASASSGDFKKTFTDLPLPIPDDVRSIYNDSWGTNIQDSTITPSFLRAAALTNAFWNKSLGLRADGVISIDPVALSHLLKATGPISMSTGDVLTSDNVVNMLLSEVYARWPNPNPNTDDALQQDNFYREAVSQVFDKIASGEVDSKALINEVVNSWSERRLLFWSGDEAEQKQIAEAGLNGEPPVSDASTDRVGVYFSDAIGSKMDYYLRQNVELSQAVCAADGRQHFRVTVNMKNVVTSKIASGLSEYVTGGNYRGTIPIGDIKLMMLFYAPEGTEIAGATLDGNPVTLDTLNDGSFPVARIISQFGPESDSTITVDLVSKESQNKAFEAQVTPLVTPTEVTSKELDCSTVG